MIKLISIIYKYRTYESLLSIFRRIRSCWLQSQFKSCGNSTRFEKTGLIKGFKNIIIGNQCYFAEGLHLTSWTGVRTQIDTKGTIEYKQLTPVIKIGDGCFFGAYNHITCTHSIIIGDNFLSGKWVTITDNSHGIAEASLLDTHPSLRPIYSKGPVVIGKNVWVGEKPLSSLELQSETGLLLAQILL